jgi:hypothetical protein
VISEGKWIGEIESQGLSPAPPLQENARLNDTRLYIYVNKEKRKAYNQGVILKWITPFSCFG